MDNEEYVLKTKYVKLLNNLNQIKSEMDTTNEVLKDIYNISKNMVMIDNLCMENDLFNDIKKKESNNTISVVGTINKIQNRL